jgi:hypothetical protein
MALVHYERAATGYVDASFFPHAGVLDAAAVVGERRGLRADWLNCAAEQFLPPVPDDQDQVVIDRGGVTIAVGSAKLLLAMKLRADCGRHRCAVWAGSPNHCGRVPGGSSQATARRSDHGA